MALSIRARINSSRKYLLVTTDHSVLPNIVLGSYAFHSDAMRDRVTESFIRKETDEEVLLRLYP